MTQEITLIVAPGAAIGGEEGDRLGGEEHGLAERAVKKAVRSVSVDTFSDQLKQLTHQTKTIAQRFEAGLDAYEVGEIAIGFAVTGEGTIGVATVGVEASITVSLRRREESPAG